MGNCPIAQGWLRHWLITNQKKNNFNEFDLNKLKEKLEELKKKLYQPTNVLIEQQSNSFINLIFIRFSKF